jgi:hypothetical protein
MPNMVTSKFQTETGFLNLALCLARSDFAESDGWRGFGERMENHRTRLASARGRILKLVQTGCNG